MNEDGQNPKQSRIGRMLLFLILLLLVVTFLAAQLGLSSTSPEMVDVRIQPQRTADYGPWDEVLVRRVDPVVGTLVAEDFLATLTTTAVISIAQVPTSTETRILPTLHPSLTPSDTPTITDTPTATLTPTATNTRTATMTLSPTATQTLTPSITPSITRTPTPTPSITLTRTPSNTPTPTETDVPMLPPRAEFSWQQTTSSPPYQVDFFNLSSGGVATSIIWNFGDGGSSTLREPTHYFSAPGTYLVSLTMSGPGGTDSALHDVLVLDAVRANFTYVQNPNGVNQIQFVNLSSGLITITSWNFGDGTSSLLLNPVHAYSAPGTYMVSLMVNGPIGSSTVSLPVTVYGAPTANFTASPPSVTLGQAVSLNNTSTRSLITGYQWNLGDGAGTSTLADLPPYTYAAAGTYTITLTVFGPGGTDTHTQTVTVVGGADVRVIKAISDSSPLPGDTVIYTITAFNDGPLPTTNVLADDNLPPEVIYISDNSGGTYNPGTGVWNIGSMPVGGSVSLAITVQVNPVVSPGTSSTNTATISSSLSDPDSANNADSANFVVGSDFDLAVTKTVNNNRPNIGDTITYTLTVSNLSAVIDGTGIQITDMLPTELIYQSDSSGGAYNPGSGVWMVGTLGSGAMATLTIDATVSAGATPGVPVTNTATLTAVTPADPNPANNTTNAVFQVAMADLSLTLSSSDYNPLPGDTITITVTINNAGPDDATGVQVGTENFLMIPAGGSDGYSYDFPIAPNYSPGVIQFLSEIDAADQYDSDSTPGNLSTTEDDDDQITVTVQPAADLEVTITADDVTPPTGAQVTLTISVDNLGPVDATGVEVIVPLPAGLAYDSDDGGGAYNPITETWTIGGLLVSDPVVTLNLTTQVAAAPGSVLDVAADVSGSPTDHIPGNNSDTVTLNVTP